MNAEDQSLARAVVRRLCPRAEHMTDAQLDVDPICGWVSCLFRKVRDERYDDPRLLEHMKMMQEIRDVVGAEVGEDTVCAVRRVASPMPSQSVIESSLVVSEPGAAIKVTEYKLTPEAKAGLNVGSADALSSRATELADKPMFSHLEMQEWGKRLREETIEACAKECEVEAAKWGKYSPDALEACIDVAKRIRAAQFTSQEKP